MAQARMDPRTAALLFWIAWPLFIIWGFGYETVWQRLVTEVDGVVVATRDSPSPGAPRYATHYVIRASNGKAHAYTAGATDADLERSLPVGTRISKRRWELGYTQDGRWIRFPIAFYVIILVGAACMLAWCGFF